ncbi:unnamed protein product [Soboliphyme baturini]|uniref:Sas10 domain-containing protein n=1 Tax=Soboliphyme baturini TaxID=241478 RepID=A0A183IP48_9BILA|nr:unnamed protein product [Soboliphyme baturini]
MEEQTNRSITKEADQLVPVQQIKRKQGRNAWRRTRGQQRNVRHTRRPYRVTVKELPPTNRARKMRQNAPVAGD